MKTEIKTCLLILKQILARYLKQCSAQVYQLFPEHFQALLELWDDGNTVHRFHSKIEFFVHSESLQVVWYHQESCMENYWRLLVAMLGTMILLELDSCNIKIQVKHLRRLKVWRFFN